jgi:hypothetical protein
MESGTPHMLAQSRRPAAMDSYATQQKQNTHTLSLLFPPSTFVLDLGGRTVTCNKLLNDFPGDRSRCMWPRQESTCTQRG